MSISIQFMLWAFVSLSWQSMTAWHTYTKAHFPLIDIMTWRLRRTPESYLKIVAPYQPTKLQISTKYPSIIDWAPWPALRDKLILLHSTNPRLDTLICEIGNSYVVPADLSRLVQCDGLVWGYVGVWDLVRAIAPAATQSPRPESGIVQEFGEDAAPYMVNDSDAIQNAIDSVNLDTMAHATLPAPSAAALFSSRVLAVQAFKALGMDRGAFNFRMDPAFFERHPELFDANANIIASGVPLRPTGSIPMPMPRELDSSILGQYKEMSKYTLQSVGN
jgi:hypothetical protein